LKRLQLADALRPYPAPGAAAVPRGGWLRAIREALGMTQSQLGARASISRQRYLTALRTADARDYGPLLAFVRS
jgi:predicted transcriptional regulator